MRQLSTPEEHRDIGFDRLVFFSDAIFAIAATLLAIDIKIPQMSEAVVSQSLASTFQSLFPQFYTFALGFLIIGAFWMGHHRIFRVIKGYDNRLLFINLLFLLCIAFMPVPSKIISEYGNHRQAAIFYASSMAVTGTFQSFVWLYATWRHRFVDPNLALRSGTIRTLITPAVFLISIPITFISIPLAEALWALIWLSITKIYFLAPQGEKK